MAITAKQGAQYLNETLKSLGYDYQIDDTSDATLTAGFQAVGAFPPNMLDNILNMQMKILVQRAYSSMFNESKNPTRRFWRDAVDYGAGIQETFLKLVEAEDGYWASDFDGTDDETLAGEISRDLVSFKKDEVINKIHPVNKKFRIKMSVSDLEYAKVFTPNGYADFVGTKYVNFQQSAEAKLMNLAIDTIKDMVANKHVVFKSGFDVNTANGVTTLVESLNSTSDGMETLSDIYNYDRVKTSSSKEDLYLVTTPELFNRIKSRGYANAFNLQEYINDNKIIMLPAGTDLGTGENGKAIGAILLDYRAVLMAVKYWEVQPFIVANTDYRNTFLKVQLVAGYTEFFNAVAFETGDVDFFTDAQQGYAMWTLEYTVNSIDGVKFPSDYIKINGRSVSDYLAAGGEITMPTSSALLNIPVGSFVEIDASECKEIILAFKSGLIYELGESHYASTCEFFTTATDCAIMVQQ